MGCATGLLSRWRSYRAQRMAELLDIRTVSDARGRLSVLEKLPFDIKRVYYLHAVAEGMRRGGHAQRTTERFLLAIAGSFKVTTCQPGGTEWKTQMLWRPTVALHIKPMEWLELHTFSPDAVCLVLASTEHDPADSVRDFKDFLRVERAA